MAFCKNCGAELQGDSKLCPACGQSAAEDNSQSGSGANKFTEFMENVADETGNMDQEDVEKNKVLAILAYLGILVLVPIFAAPDSKFARFHANQGLILCIIWVGYAIVENILLAILRAIFPIHWTGIFTFTRSPIYGILSSILNLVFVALIIPAILGIINAVNGKAKELPVIGKYRILK